MYLSSKRPFQRFPYSFLADVVCMWLSSTILSSICTAFPCFSLIFQCIMQHHCTVLSVQNRFFLAMLRQYGLLSRHFLSSIYWTQFQPRFQQFHFLITSNTPRPPKKGTVLRRRLRWAAWRYSTGKEASLALPLLLITQHLYIRGISAAY